MVNVDSLFSFHLLPIPIPLEEQSFGDFVEKNYWEYMAVLVESHCLQVLF